MIETETKTLIAGCKNSLIPLDGSVTSIGSEAFYDCTTLSNMIIPSSVPEIGDVAFAGCTSLKTVYYTGSREQWQQISVGLYNDPLLDADIIYNYKG